MFCCKYLMKRIIVASLIITTFLTNTLTIKASGSLGAHEFYTINVEAGEVTDTDGPVDMTTAILNSPDISIVPDEQDEEEGEEQIVDDHTQ